MRPLTGARLSFQILPGVKVIIAHTETRGPLGDSHLGEVRLQSPAHPRSRSVPSSPFCPRFGSSEPWGRTCFGESVRSCVPPPVFVPLDPVPG